MEKMLENLLLLSCSRQDYVVEVKDLILDVVDMLLMFLMLLLVIIIPRSISSNMLDSKIQS